MLFRSRYADWKTRFTNLGIQLLATDPEQVYRFHDANRDLPVDYIVIRPVESTDGQYYRDHEPYDVINAIQDVSKTDSRVVTNYKWFLLDRYYEHCIGEWSQIAINELGEVMYCCHKPFQIVGHIMDADILEKKRNAVTDMKLCDVPCRLSGVNHDLEAILKPQTNQEFI